jgi:CBS domain-containing protein
MQIADIMARALEFIAPDAYVQEAAELMGELDVGALPVGSVDDLQGILTDRDLLLRVLAEGREPRKVKVRDVMSTRVFTCQESDSLAQAMDMMGSYHVRRLPVVDDRGVVTGWVTLSDISRRLLLETATVRKALAELTGPGASPAGGSA